MSSKIPYKVKDSSIHGKGLYATTNIPKGTTIIEYIGEKITNKEAAKREKVNDKKGLTYIFYLDDDKHSIDGAVGGNDSIYINHSCDPNCKYVYRNHRIFIVSKKEIKKGEELTFDYEFDPDEGIIPCTCGSKNCRRTINNK